MSCLDGMCGGCASCFPEPEPMTGSEEPPQRDQYQPTTADLYREAGRKLPGGWPSGSKTQGALHQLLDDKRPCRECGGPMGAKCGCHGEPDTGPELQGYCTREWTWCLECYSGQPLEFGAIFSEDKPTMCDQCGKHLGEWPEDVPNAGI